MERIAEALDAARATSSRNAKVDAIAEALLDAAVRDEPALRMAVRVALAQAFAPFDERTAAVGWRMLMPALSAASGVSEEEIAAEARRTGDLGDAAELVLAQRPKSGAGLSPADVSELFDALARAGSRGTKARLLTNALSAASPRLGKYLTKTLLGEARTGVVEGVVMLAISKAFGADHDEVRRAHALVSDAAVVARLAYDRGLGNARLVLGHPVQPMLASPIEASKAPVDWGRVIVEDKLDGVRAQLHAFEGKVVLFGRGQGTITGAFPDVVRALQRMMDVVLDGEILAVNADAGPRPFQALQARLGRKSPEPSLLLEVPAAFFAYDILFHDGESLIELPWTERRKRLEALASDYPLRVNPYWPVASERELESAFTAARARGHEGVMLKRTDAPYEAGARGASWLKVKHAAATLDVVVTAVEQGHGKRAHVISDYTFAVAKGDELVDVGKAYSGLTDVEIAELTPTFEALTISQRGGWRKVTPTIVLEVAFDGLQRSDRHESGYSMRFPRIVRVRGDKSPTEIDTLETVARIYASHVESGHREEPLPPKTKTKTKKAVSADQLDLFGEPKKR